MPRRRNSAGRARSQSAGRAEMACWPAGSYARFLLLTTENVVQPVCGPVVPQTGCVVVGLSGQLREKQSSCIQQAKLLKTMKSVHLRHYLCFAYFIFWSLKLFHVSPIRDNLRCCSRHYFGPHNNTRKHVWSVKTSLHPIQAKTCMQTCTLVGPEMMLYAARSDRTAGARCHLHLHTAPCTRCI